jgi:putative inorganic carbon (HCO3(-)) transporter
LNVRVQSIPRGTAQVAAPPRAGFLYGWLLLALFVEYARPASFLPFLDFPFFYSIVPMALLIVSTMTPGLRPMREIFSDRIAKYAAIMFFLVLIAIPLAHTTEFSIRVAEQVTGRVFLFLLIARLVTTLGRVRGVIVALFLAHMLLLAMNPEALFNPETRNYIKGASFLGDGNDYALSLCILLPCLIEMGLGTRRKIWKLVCFAGALVVVFAIIATQSRGGTLGLLAVLGWLWWRSPRKVVAGAAIMVIAVAGLLYAPPEYFTRMDTLTTGATDRSAQARITAWKGAIGMGLKNPVFGVGTGHFGQRWGMTAHSTYMLTLAELGLPGFLCVIMLVFGNIYDNSKMRTRLLARAGPSPDDPARKMARTVDLFTTAMVGFAVPGAFLSAAYYPHIYVLAGLLISVRQIALPLAGSNTPATARIGR